MGYPMAVERSHVTSNSLFPVADFITGRTRLIRRSALVKVPSFSKNDVPGKKTWANLEVSFKNRS